jgi:hypothetical protein
MAVAGPRLPTASRHERAAMDTIGPGGEETEFSMEKGAALRLAGWLRREALGARRSCCPLERERFGGVVLAAAGFWLLFATIQLLHSALSAHVQRLRPVLAASRQSFPSRPRPRASIASSPFPSRRRCKSPTTTTTSNTGDGLDGLEPSDRRGHSLPLILSLSG